MNSHVPNVRLLPAIGLLFIELEMRTLEFLLLFLAVPRLSYVCIMFDLAVIL